MDLIRNSRFFCAGMQTARSRCSGITVLELLVVIGIIVALSALAVPAIRGLTRSNTISSANRQLLDDFGLARQRAINERSIVHIVFVSTNVVDVQPTGSQRNQK